MASHVPYVAKGPPRSHITSTMLDKYQTQYFSFRLCVYFKICAAFVNVS